MAGLSSWQILDNWDESIDHAYRAPEELNPQAVWWRHRDSGIMRAAGLLQATILFEQYRPEGEGDQGVLTFAAIPVAGGTAI